MLSSEVYSITQLRGRTVRLIILCPRLTPFYINIPWCWSDSHSPCVPNQFLAPLVATVAVSRIAESNSTYLFWSFWVGLPWISLRRSGAKTLVRKLGMTRRMRNHLPPKLATLASSMRYPTSGLVKISIFHSVSVVKNRFSSKTEASSLPAKNARLLTICVFIVYL